MGKQLVEGLQKGVCQLGMLELPHAREAGVCRRRVEGDRFIEGVQNLERLTEGFIEG